MNQNSLPQNIIPFRGKFPLVAASAFVAPTAWITGDVIIEEDVSIFFGAVLRGDLQPMRVGKGSNIQEHAMVHTTSGRSSAVIGQYVTVGHRAIIHGCSVGNRCLIGMGSIILDDTIIEDDCLIAAGSVIPEGKRIPARSLVMGVPGKVVRELSDEEVTNLPSGAYQYIEVGRTYREHFSRG